MLLPHSSRSRCAMRSMSTRPAMVNPKMVLYFWPHRNLWRTLRSQIQTHTAATCYTITTSKALWVRVCLSLSNSKTLNIIIIYSSKLLAIKNAHTLDGHGARYTHTHTRTPRSHWHETVRCTATIQNAYNETPAVKPSNLKIHEFVIWLYLCVVVATLNMKWNRPLWPKGKNRVQERRMCPTLSLSPSSNG